MKRLVVCMLILAMSLNLFGCFSTGGEDKSILDSLMDEKLVDKDLKLIDEVTEIGTTLFRSEDTYCIYETGDSELIAIMYEDKSIYSTDYDYIVRIYTKVSTNKVEYIDDTSSLESWCEYKDGKMSEENKYSMTNVKEYYAYKKESKSGVSYEFEEAKKN